MRTKADENLRLVRLLASETVQKDLGLTAEQVATINKAVKESQAHTENILRRRGKFFLRGTAIRRRNLNRG